MQASSCLAQLRSLRDAGVLCDVILKVASGQEYPAHSLLLIANSALFAEHLADMHGTPEAPQPLIMAGVTSDEMALVLDYIYANAPQNEHQAKVLEPLIRSLQLTSINDLPVSEITQTDGECIFQIQIHNIYI